ncbi:aminoacylase-1-like isoform X2 [Culicoides brevitarsis]|uniref:aminoacylase-1-like isoform X2 n=1 Tax=Culicoides brevitarsis TaxID=469753 RepID=UPI00307BA8B6
MTDYENNEEIKIFREYLRIPTVHPNIDYEPCIEFLKGLAKDLSLETNVFRPAHPKKPILVMTWKGREPELPAILLHSHMDVVPVFEESWTHPPFAAEIDNEGKIFARGAQDMKCVGMQYLGAIRAFKRAGVTFKRTIHLSFGAEEELGGIDGMKEFVKSEDFRRLNIGFSLDEGIASPDESFPVFYAERSVWRFFFRIRGNTGHGSLLLENTPGEKLRVLLDKMMDFRDQECQKLVNDPNLTVGDVTTVNLTQIKGGVQNNVIPAEFSLGFDVRIAIDVDHKEFEDKIRKWCEEAGGDIEIEFGHKLNRVEPTKLDESNVFWMAFKQATDEMNLVIKPLVFPGGTDSRFIRALNIPAIGFSPMNHTPVLLHDHDEFIKADIYLKGIEIYKNIITKVANA